MEVRVLSKEHFVLVRSRATALAIASTAHWLRSAIARGTPCSDFRDEVLFSVNGRRKSPTSSGGAASPPLAL